MPKKKPRPIRQGFLLFVIDQDQIPKAFLTFET